MLREEKASGSETAEMIDGYIKEGKIVPASVTVGLLKAAMIQSGKKKFLVDGFPRSKENLDVWYEVMGNIFVLNMVLVFHCPEEVLQERLLSRGLTSGRSDDNIESIKKRFKTFHVTSEPVIAEFKRMGKVKIVDSVPSVSERSERALMKTRILAMKCAKWLQTATATTELTHSMLLTRFIRFARRSLTSSTVE